MCNRKMTDRESVKKLMNLNSRKLETRIASIETMTKEAEGWAEVGTTKGERLDTEEATDSLEATDSKEMTDTEEMQETEEM